MPLDVPLDDLALEPIDGRRGDRLLQGAGVQRRSPSASPRRPASTPAEVAPATLVIEGWPPEGGLPAHGPDMRGIRRASATRPVRPRRRSSTARRRRRPRRWQPRRARATSSRRARRAPASRRSTRPNTMPCARWRSWSAGSPRRATQGVVAVDAETTGRRPDAGELCGIALALEPGFACYVPLGHRTQRRRHVRRRAARRTRFRSMQALAALKPLLEDPAALKIGQNIKFDWLVLARHGIEHGADRRHHADVLRARRRRAGRPRHGGPLQGAPRARADRR